VPKRYTKPRQVIIRQVGQNITVNRLLGKQGAILAKPNSFKPRVQIQTLDDVACYGVLPYFIGSIWSRQDSTSSRPG
jgi:hypothetical protein